MSKGPYVPKKVQDVFSDFTLCDSSHTEINTTKQQNPAINTLAFDTLAFTRRLQIRICSSNPLSILDCLSNLILSNS